ncbi:MAG: hypothetical protein EAZ12_08680 [Sphingobacteriia bacterium]|nr:MAG: hypothetical protein EAZ12_08680 [Sphingobacteriia bacterium]
MLNFLRTIFVYIIGIFIFHLPVLAQTQNSYPSPNKVIVLGSVHSGNKSYTVKKLYQILKEIKPDIILLEFDSTTIAQCAIPYVFGQRTAEFLGIWKNPIEYRASRNYQRKNKEVCLVPFDVHIPNRTTYVKYQYQMESSHYAAMNQLYNENKFSSADSAIYEPYAKLNNAFLQKMDSNLLVINRSSLMDTVQQIVQLEATNIKTLTNKYNELQPYSNWFNANIDYWEQRNKKMCQNLARELNANSGKTIVILTGLMHKYYITNFLKQKELERLCTLVSLNDIIH